MPNFIQTLACITVMTQNTIHKEEFNSDLGVIRLELISDHTKLELLKEGHYQNGNSRILKTYGHQIEIFNSSLINSPNLIDSRIWAVRILKFNELKERIEFKCCLDKKNSNLETDTAAGEHLDAVCVMNENLILHIGTEDGEIMNSRAKKNDWLPDRFQSELNLYHSFTHYLPGNIGFETKLPQLNQGEKWYFHYILALSENLENDVSGWLAVDATKRQIENSIGVV